MLSFAVTAFNEMSDGRDNGQKLLRCISAAQKHPAISEIVVVDDGSEDQGELLGLLLQKAPDVSMVCNHDNLGVFGNKVEAIARCNGDWVITCDSDNFMDTAYLDLVTSMERLPDVWYCPSFARPRFDYRDLVGQYDLRTIADIINHPIFACCGNTGNQVVHQESFMEVFAGYRGERADLLFPNWLGLTDDQRREHKWRLVFDACDSFILNMTWLQNDGSLAIVEGMEYEHHWSRGDASSYTRAPRDKKRLAKLLLGMLKKECQACQS